MIIDTNFIDVKKNGDECKISLWNRDYTIGHGGAIFSSIISNGKEILARPATVNAISEGEKIAFGKTLSFVVADENTDRKTVVCTFESNSTVVNICHIIEEDGCDDITVSVMPRGRSVAQVFGLAPLRTDLFNIDKLYIDFPIKKTVAEFYHTFPFGGLIGNTKDIPNTNLDYAGAIPEGGFHCAFKEQIFLGGRNCGLGLFFSDNSAWNNTDKANAVQVIEEEDCFVIRLNILDEAPEAWQYKGKDNQYSIDLDPLRVKLGMIVTPVRPYPKREFYQRSLHIDCFKKIFCNYDEFLSGKMNADGTPVVGELSEIGFDRIKRLGVKVLYIHEKWNDIQNSPILTEDTVKRIKYIIAECHKRDIKVIPYFGYELSTLSPIWAKYGDDLTRLDSKIKHGHWYRYPYQRDRFVCMASIWPDILYNGITKLYDELGFDGLYFDTTTSPRACKNEKHGCGYRDKDGNLQPTYPVWQIREFIKKTYAFVKSRGGTMNVHSFGSFNLPSLAFCDSLWEGETFQSLLLKGKLFEMPEMLMRAQFTGVDTGIPVYSLCYSNEPVWTFKSASSIALLHGSVPKPVDIGEPLELMSEIWDALDAFPLESSEWKPYFEPCDKISCNNSEVKISVWESEDKILAVCASTYTAFKDTVTITSKYPNIRNALSGEQLSVDGKITTDLCGFDFVLLECTK